MVKRKVRDIALAEPFLESAPLQEDNSSKDFSVVLRSAMRRRGITAADLSRAIQSDIPAFSPGNISHYLAGRSLPRSQVLNLLSQILETDLQQFAVLERSTDHQTSSEASSRLVSGSIPTLSVSDAGAGAALVCINQKVPWPVALRILQIFQESDAI